jgi:hypothetical protein
MIFISISTRSFFVSHRTHGLRPFRSLPPAQQS